MIQLLKYLTFLLVFGTFAHAGSAPKDLTFKRSGGSGRLLYSDTFKQFIEVGNGLCRDEHGRDGAHRSFSDVDFESIETWCQTHICAGVAFLEAQQQAIVYTTFGCTTSCELDAWVNNPNLITKSDNHESVGVWTDAVCYRTSDNSMQTLALRRNLMGPALGVAALEAAFAIGNVVRAARIYFTIARAATVVRSTAQAFMTGFGFTIAVEEASMKYHDMDMSDWENQKEAINRAFIGGAISATAEVVWSIRWLQLARGRTTLGFRRTNAATQGQQTYLWRTYGLRAANPLAQRTVRGVDANGAEFRQAARTWYQENEVRFATDAAFTGNAAADAAANPGWYYNLAIKTALRNSWLKRFRAETANWAYYNFAPTVGISFLLGFAVDAFHDWSAHEEIFLEWIPQKISQAAVSHSRTEGPETRRFLKENVQGPEFTPEMEQALMEKDEQRRPLSFDLQENMDKVNFLHSITEEEFNRLRLSQTPEGRNTDCSDIGEVEGRDCKWMYDVTYDAKCAHDRYTAFQEAIGESNTEMQKPSCEEDSPWIYGEASEVSPYASDSLTCPQFRAKESRHTWVISITSLFDEIVFNFCPKESERTEFEDSCHEDGVMVGPKVNYVLESMDGTVQAICGSDNIPKDHMLEVDCGDNGEFMKIKVREVMKWSLLTSPTKEELDASDLPKGTTPFSFNALTFRLTVQPVSVTNKKYHFRQTCVKDPYYFNFFSTIMTDTYDKCIDQNFPQEDETYDICWPRNVEHDCQFCTKLGYEFDTDTDSKIGQCRNKGYDIEPCLGAKLQHKVESEVMCWCEHPDQGRIGMNGFKCDDDSHDWCAETEICWNFQKFEKINPRAGSPCSTSACYKNDYVPGSNTWMTSCWMHDANNCKDPSGMSNGCCCKNGYKVGLSDSMFSGHGTKTCVRCGRNE